MSKLNKAEKFFKSLRDDGSKSHEAWWALERKFHQCVRKYADVDPKPYPSEYKEAFKKYFDN